MKKIKTELLEYSLPADLYARTPVDENGKSRDHGRMAVAYKDKPNFDDSKVTDITNFLEKGDLLVLNNSLTIPPIFEVFSKKQGYFNIHLNEYEGKQKWLCTVELLKEDLNEVLNNKKRLSTDDKEIEVKLEKHDSKIFVSFNTNLESVYKFLIKYGTPVQSAYVKKNYSLKEYQNDIGKVYGSLENPAANRHFTPALLKKLEEKGALIAFVTLHCGSETAYIKSDNVYDHKVQKEYFEIPHKTASLISKVKQNGHRVFAIGTTSARTLESVKYDDNYNIISDLSGFTDLAIYPGHNFKILDGILTNFHGSRSSRLALAAAFVGVEKIMRLYNFAIEHKYHFYEFGDACFLIINSHMKGDE